MDHDSGSFKRLQRKDPRWLLSYADLMSLLFAMFVMLLSFADFNKETFQKHAGPINKAFTDHPPTTPMTTQHPSGGKSFLEFIRPSVGPEADEDQEEIDEETLERAERLRQAKQLVGELRTLLTKELQRDEVDLIENDTMVTVRFRDRAAFALGDRELAPAILPTLDSIAAILARTPGRIRVEGHTDDAPIATSLFRSNWDLSAARAASVVHRLLKSAAIDPTRISAEGFADSRPLKPNTTPEGRAMNRRVEVSVEMMAPERAKAGNGK